MRTVVIRPMIDLSVLESRLIELASRQVFDPTLTAIMVVVTES